MNASWIPGGLLVAALLVTGCANPADDVAPAAVGEAKPVASRTETAESSDPARTLLFSSATSTIGFLGSKVTGSHDGGFHDFSGTIALNDEGTKVVGITAEIDMHSTWSDNNRLTAHLKNEDFFEVETYPTSSFVATEIAPGSGGAADATHTITGNLTLHGVTKSISFPATLAIRDDAVTLDSEFFLNRRDFDINYSGRANDLIRDEVVITLAIRAPRPDLAT